MSKFARPLLVTAILVVTAFYLDSPQPAIIALLAGSLVGYLIGSVKGTGAEFSVLALGIASIFFGSLLTEFPTSFWDQPIVIPTFHYAIIGSIVGFIFVGTASLLSRPQ